MTSANHHGPVLFDYDGVEHAKAAISPPLDGICELALETADRRGLETFYTAVLGFRVLSRDDDRTWLACGSRARLGLWDPGEKEFGDEGGRHVHFAFSAAPGTLDVLARRLETLGIEHRGPLEHDGGDRSLYVEDPAGNVVEFWDYFVRGRTVTALERASTERPALPPVNPGRAATSTTGRAGRPGPRWPVGSRKLKQGRYRFALVATDGDGLRSNTRYLSFRTVRR